MFRRRYVYLGSISQCYSVGFLFFFKVLLVNIAWERATRYVGLVPVDRDYLTRARSSIKGLFNLI